MRPPKFWARRADERAPLAARLLSPIAAVTAAAARARARRDPAYRPRVPVICVGNLVVGGAGKTPTVLAICERLAARGLDAHILSRGYGGRVRGPHRVDPATDTAQTVGDEPLLLAMRRPVWVGADRVQSAVAAEYAGADVLVMDDGHQNPGLEKDLSLLVIDAAFGHGNGRVLPAGPLREPLRDGFARADAAIMVGDPPHDANGHALWPWTPADLPKIRARIAPLRTGLPINGRRVVAFAGIGRPEKFFDTLRDMGARIVEAAAFPDHHIYSSAILTRLENRAKSAGALLVTTEKDAVRLPKNFRGKAFPIPVALGFEDPAKIDRLLARIVVSVPEEDVEQPR